MSKGNSTPTTPETKPSERAGELLTEDPDHGDDENPMPTPAELEAAGQERLIA